MLSAFDVMEARRRLQFKLDAANRICQKIRRIMREDHRSLWFGRLASKDRELCDKRRMAYSNAVRTLEIRLRNTPMRGSLAGGARLSKEEKG